MANLGPKSTLFVKGLHQGGQFGRFREVIIVYEEAVILFALSNYVGHKVFETGHYLLKGLLICSMWGFSRVEMNFVNSLGKYSGIGPATDSTCYFLQEIHALIVAEVDIGLRVIVILFELFERLGIMLLLDTVYFGSAGRHNGRAAVGIAQLVKVWNLGLFQISALYPASVNLSIGKSVFGFDSGNLLVAAFPVLHGDAYTAKNIM